MSFEKKIILGSRGSALARAQTDIVVGRLRKKFANISIETRYIVTSGDKDQKSYLSAIGGKGIFIRELEQALLDGTIDMAIHSFKDVTSQLADGLTLSGFLTPESVCDVMITRNNVSFDSLPDHARIGTGSVRRIALLKRLRPDITTAEIRGNIDTRIAKVERGEYDAVILSEAGLIRCGLTDHITVRFDPTTFYPAPGQGVITIETRSDDEIATIYAAGAGDGNQHTISTAELSLLTTVGFDCRTPLGVYSTIESNMLTMQGFFIAPTRGSSLAPTRGSSLAPDSDQFREAQITGPVSAPYRVGNDLAQLLLRENG